MPNLLEALTSGWLSCETGREELVAVSKDQLLELAAGGLPCPACKATCKPKFRRAEVAADVAVVKWKDGAWIRAFVLRR